MSNEEKRSRINGKKLTSANIAAIESLLAKDQRVELIPTCDGVRVIHIRREEVKYAAGR